MTHFKFLPTFIMLSRSPHKTRASRIYHKTKAVTFGLTALTLAIGSAHAAGLEYTKQSVAPFFQPGNYAEVAYGHVELNIEGVDNQGNKIDNMMDDFALPSAAIKVAPTPNTALALLYDTPFGVDTVYPDGNIFHNQMGTTEARVSTDSFTLLGGGKLTQGETNNVWLYGGLEYQTLQGNVTGAQPVGLTSALSEGGYTQEQYDDWVKNPNSFGGKLIKPAIDKVAAAPTYYTLDFEKEHTLLPVVGMAFEKPEIALRAALTYRAPAKYQVSGKENLQVILPVLPVPGGGDGVTPTPAAEGLPLSGSTEVKMPQSVNLDFQTGLSEKYQLLGMVNARWVDWSNFNVTPPVALEATKEPLAAYNKDGYSVEVALGKQFNPKFSGEVRVGYDHGTGEPLSLLGPYGAIKSLGLGGEYKVTDNLSVAAGGQYMWFDGGEVITKVDGKVADIDDGTGFAVGMKVGYHF